MHISVAKRLYFPSRILRPGNKTIFSFSSFVFFGYAHGKSDADSETCVEVEIPCVELERYSVMFRDVLRPQVRQSKPQASLLARRQVYLEELHTVTDSNSEVCCCIVIRTKLANSQRSNSLLTLLCQIPIYELIQYH